jgi:hypothetical protein
MTLHNKIMNIPCEPDRLAWTNNGLAYKQGHKSARHAAAELAVKAEDEIDRLISSIDLIADYLASDRSYERSDAVEDLRAILSQHHNTE